MSFKGFVTFIVYGPRVDPFFSVCLPIEWRGVTKRLLPVKLGLRRGPPRNAHSSLITAMSIEELRSFSQVPVVVKLEVSDCTAIPTIEGADNVVYFTQEQFTAGLRFLIMSLVKQFLHFTRAPPTLIHPKVFRILISCRVLNFLYQLDILLVEICFTYTLKLGIGGHLSMSTHSPRLQFVTRLPDSSKTKAKGVVLVKGSWYETSGSLRLPFDLNQSLSFPSVFQLSGACTPLGRLCFDMPLFSEFFLGRHRRGWLVS